MLPYHTNKYLVKNESSLWATAEPVSNRYCGTEQKLSHKQMDA
jgi:hypothetical protein